MYELEEKHADLFNNLWMRGLRGQAIIDATREGLAARGLTPDEVVNLTPDHRDLSVWGDLAEDSWNDDDQARWNAYKAEHGLIEVDLGCPAVYVYQPRSGKLAEGYTLSEIWNTAYWR